MNCFPQVDLHGIRKAVIETVVLFDDEVIDPKLIEDGKLADIEFEMDKGDCLGISTLKSMDIVAPSDLLNEQLAVGSDGSFFPPDDNAGPAP